MNNYLDLSQLSESHNPNLIKILDNSELLFEEARIRKARSDFWEYRQLLNPKMKKGWFQKDVAKKLQEFERQLIAGEKPILIIEAPPQHGKSVQVIEFISWLAGRHPQLRTIFSSFSERLGIRANLRLQRIYDSDLYKRIFPLTKINSSGTIALSGQYLRNREILEYVGMEGYFRNTTVQGSITGESLDLGVIDDPLKGRKEANSETVRNATWDWFTDDFFTRFSEDAGMLFILTRWHIDDPVGRLIKTNPSNITVLKYPAIAIENEKYRKEGEPLFPEHKSLKFLLERRKVQGIANFEALYQQNPIVMGGKIFQKETFRYFRTPRKYKRIVQSWDTAYKPGQHNDPSVCTVWGVHDLGYDLLYVWCKKVSYPTLKKAAIDLAQEWANKDEMYARHKLFSIIIEDKASGQALIPDLRDETNFSVVAIKPEGDKLTRAHVVTPQFEAGKVFLLENANWLENYEAELLSFDNGIHDDQVDSTTQFLTYISVQSSGILQDDYVDGDFDEQTTDKW